MTAETNDRRVSQRGLLAALTVAGASFALPQAIGAQAASPGRQVISLSGDGGFSRLMGDVLSLKQLGLPVKLVVFNNGHYESISVTAWMASNPAALLATNFQVPEKTFAGFPTGDVFMPKGGG